MTLAIPHEHLLSSVCFLDAGDTGVSSLGFHLRLDSVGQGAHMVLPLVLEKWEEYCETGSLRLFRKTFPFRGIFCLEEGKILCEVWGRVLSLSGALLNTRGSQGSMGVDPLILSSTFS